MHTLRNTVNINIQIHMKLYIYIQIGTAYNLFWRYHLWIVITWTQQGLPNPRVSAWPTGHWSPSSQLVHQTHRQRRRPHHLVREPFPESLGWWERECCFFPRHIHVWHMLQCEFSKLEDDARNMCRKHMLWKKWWPCRGTLALDFWAALLGAMTACTKASFHRWTSSHTAVQEDNVILFSF